MRARRAALPESLIERVHDQVVNLRPEVANLLIVAPRMHAISRSRNRNFALRLDPDGRAGEAEVAARRRRKRMPRAGMLGRRRVPSERPGRASHGRVASPELANYFLGHE